MDTKIIATGIVLAAAGVASADIVQLEFIGAGEGLPMTYSFDGGDETRSYAGSIIHEIDGVESVTYCIEPRQGAQRGIANFEAVPLGDAFEPGSIGLVLAELAEIAGDSIWTTSVSQVDAAAFQIAIWEVVSDYNADAGIASLDLTSGAFASSGTATGVARANELLSALTFDLSDASGYTAYLNDEHQDFMGRTIPTPGALALALTGAPLLARRRRG